MRTRHSFSLLLQRGTTPCESQMFDRMQRIQHKMDDYFRDSFNSMKMDRKENAVIVPLPKAGDSMSSPSLSPKCK